MGVSERGKRGDDNETSLKEGRGIEMSTTVLHSRAAPSLCIYLRKRPTPFLRRSPLTPKPVLNIGRQNWNRMDVPHQNQSNQFHVSLGCTKNYPNSDRSVKIYKI